MGKTSASSLPCSNEYWRLWSLRRGVKDLSLTVLLTVTGRARYHTPAATSRAFLTYGAQENQFIYKKALIFFLNFVFQKAQTCCCFPHLMLLSHGVITTTARSAQLLDFVGGTATFWFCYACRVNILSHISVQLSQTWHHRTCSFFAVISAVAVHHKPFGTDDTEQRVIVTIPHDEALYLCPYIKIASKWSPHVLHCYDSLLA